MGCGSVRDLKGYPLEREREKLALSKRLCFKCLNGGHFKDRCPKVTFKCQVQDCVEDHDTLLHPDPNEQVMSKWKEQMPQTLASMVPLGTQQVVNSRIVPLQVN